MKWNLSEESVLAGCRIYADLVLPKEKYLPIGQSFMLRNSEVSYPNPEEYETEYEKPLGSYWKPDRKRVFKNHGTSLGQVSQFLLGEKKKEYQEFLETTDPDSPYADIAIDIVPLLVLCHGPAIDLLTMLIVEDSFQGKGEWVVASLDTPRPFGNHYFIAFMDGDKVLAIVDARFGEC